jgi:ferric-dicitrate binding protein FerR (iron transport regulator)
VLNKKDTSFVLAGNTVNIQAGGVKVAGEKPVQYTLVTPKGGEYSLILEDGTKVWLNADSKLVYPSGFGGGARKVQLTGEAYFEVKTDAEHPFIVHTYRQDIRVLGTEFNVQAYPEENEIVTTLITGKVQVNSKGEKVQLKQGQQAISNKNGILRLQPKADLEQAIAWKEGYFRFDYTDIYEIMRQLSRWYDIKVSYEEGVKHREFLAFINRDNNISEVLGMLEATGAIRFEINGKKITVLNGVQ